MRLLSLKLNARGLNGWESQTQRFGARTTSLHAPNGSGKTPLVQSIPFCLGFDAKFQDDIREHCSSATLTIDHDGEILKITRDFGAFHVVVKSEGSQKEYFSEGDYSKAFFETLKIDTPVLIGLNRQSTRPHLSSLLPIFYVRQIGGYDEPYKPPANFIQDQFVEMIRFAFGLGPKRSYFAQRDLIAAKDQLEADLRRVVFQQKIVDDIAARTDDSQSNRERLKQRSGIVSAQLQELRESADVAGAANDALVDLLHAKEKRIRIITRQHAELNSRIVGIDSIRKEIDGEIQTLSLNEESKRAFESFFDICGQKDCGLFISSSASYAKNLVYLKDQIKDLESNAKRAAIQLEFLDGRLEDEQSERDAIAGKLNEKQSVAATGHLITAVQSLTRELMDAEGALAVISSLSQERGKLLRFQEARSRTQDRIAALSNHGRQDLEFGVLRTHIRDLVVKWMDVIGTPNAPRDIEIDLDFKFRFGKQAIDVFSGSTRSRLILAVHAAIFEHYLQDSSRPFRFLLLDTPKQQELESVDLARYLRALEEVCEKLGGQILISATEYHHEIGDSDEEWLPIFPGTKHPMYLGKPASF